MRLVLASASPARLETLRRAGLAPSVMVSNVDEEQIAGATPGATVAELVGVLAEAKAVAVAARAGQDLDADVVVLGCDSLLELDGRPLGKPGTDGETLARWADLAGGVGTLHTGHCVLRCTGGAVVASAAAVGSATVRFGSPSAAELRAYVASGEPQQVAGGFTLDGLGGWFVEGVDGDPHTVVGVSLPLLRGLLQQVGSSLTDLGWPAG